MGSMQVTLYFGDRGTTIWARGSIMKMSQIKIIHIFSLFKRVPCLVTFLFILVAIMVPIFLVYICIDQPHPLKSQMIVEIRKREDPGDEVVWQTNKKGKKKRFRLCRCFRKLLQVINRDKIYNAVYLRSQLNESEWIIFQSYVY